MPTTPQTLLPDDYEPLKGSERAAPPNAKLQGPAGPDEVFSVTIVLRRRADGEPIPDYRSFATTPFRQRRRLSPDEFAAKYGAAPGDLENVVAFASSHGLTVVEVHPARRTVVVSGTAAQFGRAFHVELGRYERPLPDRLRPHRGRITRSVRFETYRGREGAISIPTSLSGIIVGVFGLDNRTITGQNGGQAAGDPLNTNGLTVGTVVGPDLYNFPAPPTSTPGSISQQTIGIFSPGCGYYATDLQNYFGAISPTIVPIPVNTGNSAVEAPLLFSTGTGSNQLVFPPTSGILQGMSFVAGTWANVLGDFDPEAVVSDVTTTTTETTVDIGIWDSSTQSYAPAPAGSAIGLPTIVYFNPHPEFNGVSETQMDICISATASAASSGAAGAAVAVYLSTGDEVGWVDMINRAVHPDPDDFPAGEGVSPPAVLSTSFSICRGDDPAALAASSVSQNLIAAVHAALQDAAIQGLTVCASSGDYGSSGGFGDMQAHVEYPASDPWVLAVGGTTLGGNTPTSPPPWVEFVWNDASEQSAWWGTTGGGVSDLFEIPSYQLGVNVPNSVNGTAFPGRGVPDVAANASHNSGYLGLYYLGSTGNFSLYGCGTSAAAPLWAGLIALLNANLGCPVGFLNPMLYALGSSVCNPIDPSLPALTGCPVDNGNDNVPGYPAHGGWDACTGWGSPNGTAILNALQAALAQDCSFIIDVGVYDVNSVQVEVTSAGQAVFPQAFFLVADGFSANQLGISQATVTNAVLTPPAVMPMFSGFPSGMSASLVSVQPAGALSSTGLSAVQRFTYGYTIDFTGTNAFPTLPGQRRAVPVTATIAATVPVSSAAVFELIDQAGPYLAGGSGISWLSNDIRVFQVEPGPWLLPGPGDVQDATSIVLSDTGNPATDATTFIQTVLQSLNSGTNVPASALDPSPGGPAASWFDLISTDEAASQLDTLSTDPTTNLPVYNFAVARVRYNSTAIDAQNVRAFFRLIPVSSASTSFDAATTNRRWTDGTQVIPLYGLDSTGDVISIPCFAEPRVNAASVSVETQRDSTNVQTIPKSSGEVDVYFGCWLDINQTTPQYPLNVAPFTEPDGPFTSTSLQTIQQLIKPHMCLVVELAYDPDPIAAGTPPSTSGPLAQRNLVLLPVANPGESASRLAPNPFMILPSPGTLAPGQKPDELLIDWGDTPQGSLASIYWPHVDAADVLRMAAELYTTHELTMSDAHTLRMPAGGITYLPIPPAAAATIPGLISVELPLGILKGQRFAIVVRHVGASRLPQDRVAFRQSQRRILGSFQITLSVSTKDVMLAPEERTLSVTRWIQRAIPTSNRWFPVLQRYVDQIAERVSALGGNPTSIVASPSSGITPVRRSAD
jgi:hypothetical protein